MKRDQSKIKASYCDRDSAIAAVGQDRAWIVAKNHGYNTYIYEVWTDSPSQDLKLDIHSIYGVVNGSAILLNTHDQYSTRWPASY